MLTAPEPFTTYVNSERAADEEERKGRCEFFPFRLRKLILPFTRKVRTKGSPISFSGRFWNLG